MEVSGMVRWKYLHLCSHPNVNAAYAACGSDNAYSASVSTSFTHPSTKSCTNCSLKPWDSIEYYCTQMPFSWDDNSCLAKPFLCLFKRLFFYNKCNFSCVRKITIPGSSHIFFRQESLSPVYEPSANHVWCVLESLSMPVVVQLLWLHPVSDPTYSL